MKKPSKSKSPAERRRRRQEDDVADWSRANGSLLRSVVSAVAKGGGAVRFGYSRDGGAYSLGVYGDGDPYTEYFPASGDVNEWLRGFELDYE